MEMVRSRRLWRQLLEMVLPRKQCTMGSHSHGLGQQHVKMAAADETDYRHQRWRLERVAFGVGGGASRLLR